MTIEIIQSGWKVEARNASTAALVGYSEGTLSETINRAHAVLDSGPRLQGWMSAPSTSSTSGIPPQSLLNVKTLSGKFAAPSHSESANRTFLNIVEQIPGVFGARLYGTGTLAEQAIVVVVPALRTPISRQVFELEGIIRRKFPEARMTVQVIGLKERGIADAQWTTVLPK